MKNPFETDERRAFRESVARFVARDIAPYADEWDEAGEVPWELHLKAGALGLFGFGIDEKWGGLGFDDCFMRAAASQELGGCGASGVFAALGARNISVGPIAALGSDEIRAAVLPEVLSGRESSALAVTEPSGGSDVANLRTRARRDGGDYVLDGEKTFITGGMKSRWFVVAARTGGPGLGGISLFLVEAGAPGFSRAAMTRKMGWWASDQATLRFEGVRVPARHMLGPQDRGFLAIMHNFNYERLNMVAACVGMARRCWRDALDWARQRSTFGKPLIERQVIRHKFAEMSARIDAVESYLHMICWQANEGAMPVAEVSKAKFLATKTLEFVASECMQAMGGAGYMRGNAVERTWREVKVMAIGGGSEEILRDLAARQMGL